MQTQEDLLAEWKKYDPYMLDADGFVRFLEAKNIVRLFRLGHPNEHGEPYGRFQVMDMITERGQQLLIDLKWPIAMDSEYYHLVSREIETLYDALHGGGMPELTPLHDAESELDEQFCILTGGVMGSNTGFSIYKVRELKKIAKEHKSPELDQALYKRTLYAKASYEYRHKTILTDPKWKQDVCTQNIVKIATWLDIPVDVRVSDDDLPPKDLTCRSSIWSLIQSYNPMPPNSIPVQCPKCFEDFYELKDELCWSCRRHINYKLEEKARERARKLERKLEREKEKENE